MNTPCPIPLSVIPDVGNRESRVFPCRTSPSLVVRYRGHYSEVMLALPKGYDSLIEPWGKTVLTGFPLKNCGNDREGPAEMAEGRVTDHPPPATDHIGHWSLVTGH